ncbi:unnamed protein product [Orchesella dallaii]|uniref:Gustatory receptor n=1 Tax=Orchesella dallaii TaxID=48710 RepID=A0ABP1S7W3_9HEXA
MSHKGPEIVFFINGLLELDQKFDGAVQNVELNSLEQLNGILVRTVAFSLGVTPLFFVFGFHWFAPCKPSLAFSWVLGECKNDTEESDLFHLLFRSVFKLIIFLPNVWAWTTGMDAVVFGVCAHHILCVISLRSYLTAFYDSAINNKGYFKKISTYRSIQVLAQPMNAVMEKGLLISCTVATCCIAFDITGLVKLPWTKQNSFLLTICFLLATNALLYIVIAVGGQVGVHAESKKVMEKLNRYHLLETMKGGLEYKWSSRFFRSCSKIKIKLGPNNYLEEMTPLVLVQNGINLTLTTLLLSS